MAMVCLGQGGYGTVYQYGKKAIKIIKCPINGIACYNEICITQNLEHPNILTPDYAYYSEGKVCIIMDKADTDLNKWRKHNTPTESGILDWVIQILSALAFIHKRDILHCDVKASNLLLFPDNVVKLADFSLSRRLGHRKKLHVCTHSYRPPEYWSDDAPDPGYWVDIWTLGCTLYFLIRGVPLFPPYRSSKVKKGRTEYYNQMYKQ